MAIQVVTPPGRLVCVTIYLDGSAFCHYNSLMIAFLSLVVTVIICYNLCKKHAHDEDIDVPLTEEELHEIGKMHQPYMDGNNHK